MKIKHKEINWTLNEQEAKHTPEPWSVNSSGVEIIDQHGICIAEAFKRGTETPFTEANAHRIVDCVNACEGINPKAITELLKLAKRIVDYGSGNADLWRHIHASAEAIIAKAQHKEATQ